MREAARAAVACVNVALPATVVSYDEATQSATVRPVPCFRRKDPAQGNAVVCYRPPDVPGVPVLFAGGASWSIVGPLAEGDPGLLVICDRSTDEWRATGGATVEPQDPRRHNLTDGIFIPGLRSPAAALESSAYSATHQVLALAQGVKLGSSSASQPPLQGTAFLTALQAALPELIAAATALGIPTPNSAALLANIATSLSARAPYLATKVEVE
jgi:hypothetical protein